MTNAKIKKVIGNTINKLNDTDIINNLHKIDLTGKINKGRYYRFDEPGLHAYLEYIVQLTQAKKIEVIRGKNSKIREKTSSLLELPFYKNYQINLSYLNKSKGNYSIISEPLLYDIIQKIRTSDTLNLTDDQYSFLYGGSKVSFETFINTLELPEMKEIKVHDNNKEVSDILKEMKKDKYFNQKILKIYKPVDFKYNPNQKLVNSKNVTCKTVCHGTKNISLLQILANNFKQPSELRNNDTVKTMGQALGDGIYFARLDQCSKTLAYIDEHKSTIRNRYIVIADIYFTDINYVHNYETKPFTGRSVTWGKCLGAYKRDELVVLPEQIQIKYILQLD